jgi:CheY-like chemotaxis protein
MLSAMGLRCLIIDDNAEFLVAATDILKREGIDVVGVASTIADALQRARDLRPDVYLVDIDLGGESGFDLTERLAAAPALKGPKVVLTSSYAEVDFADLISTSAAVGFLAKSELSGRALHEVLGGDGERELPG